MEAVMYYLLMMLGYLVTLAAVNIFLPAVTFSNWGAMAASAVVLTLLSVLLRPLLMLILLPLNLITLGLFSVLINTWMVQLADKFIAGFSTGGFVNAVITALLGMGIMYLLRSAAEVKGCWPFYNRI